MVLQQQRSTNSDKSGEAIKVGLELGVVVALPVVACVIVGICIDKALKTFPLVLICSVALGMFLTFVEIYKVILPFLEKRSSNYKNKK